jgi:glutamine synthetase
MTTTEIKHFLEIPYDKLEEQNLEAKTKVVNRVPAGELQEHYIRYLSDEKRLKAVTDCYSDLEGRYHMLDYDKRFLLKSSDNLTFDGSSIRGFSQVRESDLRLEIDWGSFRWLPSDVFGPGKVLVFGLIKDRDGASYPADMRGQLKALTDDLLARDAMVANL